MINIFIAISGWILDIFAMLRGIYILPTITLLDIFAMLIALKILFNFMRSLLMQQANESKKGLMSKIFSKGNPELGPITKMKK